MQVAGINLDQGDVIVQMSVSDSATAVLTKKSRLFVCSDFTVKSIRYINVMVSKLFVFVPYTVLFHC